MWLSGFHSSLSLPTEAKYKVSKVAKRSIRKQQTTACLPHSESETGSVTSNSLRPHGPYSPWNSPGQNTGVGSISLLQGIFQTQGSNPGLLHCRGILYQLGHQGSPRKLEWVAYPFSRRSSRPKRQTGPACIAGGLFLPTELPEKPKTANKTTGLPCCSWVANDCYLQM